MHEDAIPSLGADAINVTPEYVAANGINLSGGGEKGSVVRG